ncbi:MAG: RNA polymerase sigma factor [Planctomycetota bacterium]|jgi:RNA polymerase sigma-70 factor (ECF subfamily)
MVKDSEHFDLVAAAKAGNRSSLSQLAVCIRQRLYPYLERRTCDKDLSEDVLQETLLAMVRFIPRLEDLGSFWPWIYSIAGNKIKSHYRRQQRRRGLLSGGTADTYCRQRRQDSRDASDVAVDRETQQAVLAALGRLDRQYRDVVQQHCLQEMSFSEIATATGCSCEQVRTRFFRAKRSLRARLSEMNVFC